MSSAEVLAPSTSHSNATVEAQADSLAAIFNQNNGASTKKSKRSHSWKKEARQAGNVRIKIAADMIRYLPVVDVSLMRLISSF